MQVAVSSSIKLRRKMDCVLRFLYLFRSVTAVFGKTAVGVLLSGMGKDGALELKLMHDKGAVTFAQDADQRCYLRYAGRGRKVGRRQLYPPSGGDCKDAK